MRQIILKSFYFLFIISILGCAHLYKPSIYKQKFSFKEAIKNIKKSHSSIISLKGLAVLKVHSGSKKLSFSLFFFIKRPDSVRLEFLNPFGMPEIIYIKKKDNYIRYSMQTGKAEKENLNNSDSMVIVSDLFPLLFGEVPLNKGYIWNIKDNPKNRDQLILEGKGKNGRITFFIDTKKWLIIMAEKDNPTSIKEWKVTFSNFKAQNGIVFPKMIMLEIYPYFSRLSIDIKELNINPAIPKDIFSLPNN
ncbi:MAG: DUF4292 domain-containing protein [Deltaproteobacteria bacterium]|nr:DUF4292 domain-containing protein [Deltaproteobacteria bacterium]